jgi:hypothetical protein
MLIYADRLYSKLSQVHIPEKCHSHPDLILNYSPREDQEEDRAGDEFLRRSFQKLQSGEKTVSAAEI